MMNASEGQGDLQSEARLSPNLASQEMRVVLPAIDWGAHKRRLTEPTFSGNAASAAQSNRGKA